MWLRGLKKKKKKTGINKSDKSKINNLYLIFKMMKGV